MKRSSFNELTCLAFSHAVTEQMFVMISGKCPCPQTAPNHARHWHFWQEQSTRSVFQVYARHLSYRILTRRASMVSSGKRNCPTLRISGVLEYSVPSWCLCLNVLHACRLRLPAFRCLNITVATQGRRCHHIGQLFRNGLQTEQYCVVADVCLPLPGCYLAPQSNAPSPWTTFTTSSSTKLHARNIRRISRQDPLSIFTGVLA